MTACVTTPPEANSKFREPAIISKPAEPRPFGTNLGRVLRDAHILVATVNGKATVFADKG